MKDISGWLIRLHVGLSLRRSERGDVPGWVLITVMTAGLVGVIWTFARGTLLDMLDAALGSVSG